MIMGKARIRIIIPQGSISIITMLEIEASMLEVSHKIMQILGSLMVQIRIIETLITTTKQIECNINKWEITL